MKKVIVIENDTDTLEIIRFILEEKGFEVLASRTSIPIEKIIQDKPDLILLDYFLDDVDGKEICSELKANQLTRHIPTVLISTSNRIERYAKESCADAFISKPFDIVELQRLVDELT